MTKTLILLFHPDLAHSKANVVLAAAAAKLPDVEVVDMQAIYPDGIDLSKDGEREALRLLECDRIVLQFPIQWYSTPPLLKAWQDAAAVEYAATLTRWIVSSTALGVKALEPRRAAQ